MLKADRKASLVSVTALRRTIRELLPHGYPTLDSVAASVGISGRTLQRRLRESASSYSQLVDDVRLELARQLLDDGNTEIAQIAGRTGFANPSGFSHAFHRWTGKAPRAYRLTHRNSGSVRAGGAKRQVPADPKG